MLHRAKLKVIFLNENKQPVLFERTVFFRVSELTAGSQIFIIPASCPVSFILWPVNGATAVFVKSSYIRNITMIVIISIVISWKMRNIILVMHPGLINIRIDEDDKRIIQIKVCVDRWIIIICYWISWDLLLSGNIPENFSVMVSLDAVSYGKRENFWFFENAPE